MKSQRATCGHGELHYNNKWLQYTGKQFIVQSKPLFLTRVIYMYIYLSQESLPHNRFLMWAAVNYIFLFSCHHQADLWNIPTCPSCQNIICDFILWEKPAVTHFNSISWTGGTICFSCSLAPAENTCPVLTANTLSSKCLSRCCRVSRESRAYRALSIYWSGSEGNDMSRLRPW